MINTETIEKYKEMAITKRYSERYMAGNLCISVSTIRKWKKAYNMPDYDPSIIRNELKNKIKEWKGKINNTEMAHSLGISSSLLIVLKKEIKDSLL